MIKHIPVTFPDDGVSAVPRLEIRFQTGLPPSATDLEAEEVMHRAGMKVYPYSKNSTTIYLVYKPFYSESDLEYIKLEYSETTGDVPLEPWKLNKYDGNYPEGLGHRLAAHVSYLRVHMRLPVYVHTPSGLVELPWDEARSDHHWRGQEARRLRDTSKDEVIENLPVHQISLKDFQDRKGTDLFGTIEVINEAGVKVMTLSRPKPNAKLDLMHVFEALE